VAHGVCAWSGGFGSEECIFVGVIGTPGAIDTPTLDDTALRVYRRSGRCEFGECKYDFVDAACDQGCEDGACEGELCPGVCLSSPLNNALPADCERDYDMMTSDVLCLDINKACCVP
jgi:hypothetical protein